MCLNVRRRVFILRIGVCFLLHVYKSVIADDFFIFRMHPDDSLSFVCLLQDCTCVLNTSKCFPMNVTFCVFFFVYNFFFMFLIAVSALCVLERSLSARVFFRRFPRSFPKLRGFQVSAACAQSCTARGSNVKRLFQASEIAGE